MILEFLLYLQNRQIIKYIDWKCYTAFVSQWVFHSPAKLFLCQKHLMRSCKQATVIFAWVYSANTKGLSGCRLLRTALQHTTALVEGGLPFVFIVFVFSILLLDRMPKSSCRISHDYDSCMQRQDDGKIGLYHKNPSQLANEEECDADILILIWNRKVCLWRLKY